MNTQQIEVTDITKRFGSFTAVDRVSLHIRAGESFGLLGPNGAGKTTTLSLIMGLLNPDSGTVRINGDGDPRDPATRRRLGVCPQTISLYDELTAAENLFFFARLYDPAGHGVRERVSWALQFAGLEDRRSKRVSTFSGGMKRRLNLAAALIHDPQIVLMDEPTVGVDPQSRNHLFERVEQLKSEGRTIIYTTHYMEEAQKLCDRVAIMDQGKLLALDTVDTLIHQYGGESVIAGELAELPAQSQKLPGELRERRLRFKTDDPLSDLNSLARQGVKFSSFQVTRPDLETVFLSLTGRSLRDD